METRQAAERVLNGFGYVLEHTAGMGRMREVVGGTRGIRGVRGGRIASRGNPTRRIGRGTANVPLVITDSDSDKDTEPCSSDKDEVMEELTEVKDDVKPLTYQSSHEI